MSTMVKTMSSVVKKFFSTSAENVAKETQFVQRTSKMTGAVFLQTLVFGLLENPRASLTDLVAFCEEHFAVVISPQGFHGRMTGVTLTFLHQMFSRALVVFRQTVRLPVAVLTQFSALNITDSTGIELPDSLVEEFPGSGGAASASNLKLQVVLDFLTGSFRGLWLTDGITPDQKTTAHLQFAAPGSLNLFDLGYFVLDHLTTLADNGAYFLCRLLTSTNLYTQDGQHVDLLSVLRADTRDRFELALHIGKQVRLPCRVCVFRVPEEIAKRRRRHAKERMRKKGKQLTTRARELLGWTMLVTNVPVSMLSLNHVALLYAVRWQVELVFKLWKSHMQLHRISGSRKERILVELYAKLIGLVLFHFLLMPLRAKDLDLSPTKAFKRLVARSGTFAEALRSCTRLHSVLSRLHAVILKFAKREKRKTRLTTCQQLFWEVDYYA